MARTPMTTSPVMPAPEPSQAPKGAAAARRSAAPAAERDWYKDAVLYELHVRAFYDSNADGIGDFRGLAQKLDYL